MAVGDRPCRLAQLWLCAADAAEPPANSSSFIPAWLRSKLPAAVGGSREYEQEAQTLTMDKYASTLRQAWEL